MALSLDLWRADLRRLRWGRGFAFFTTDSEPCCEGQQGRRKSPSRPAVRAMLIGMADATERMADFDLTAEQRLVRAAVREFAEKEIAPFVEQHEREARYPLELIRKLVPLGYIAPLIPEQYGGSRSDVATYGVICEELARIDWVVASVVSVMNSLVATSILEHGRPAWAARS